MGNLPLKHPLPLSGLPPQSHLLPFPFTGFSPEHIFCTPNSVSEFISQESQKHIWKQLPSRKEKPGTDRTDI